MDAATFDRLTRLLTQERTRRGLARLLTALPLTGGLAALLDETGADAGRRKRRKRRHKHKVGDHKDNRKGKRKGKDKGEQKQSPAQPRGCQPESTAQTCAGKCATVTDNCGTRVDCGACTCAAGCPTCQTCNPATGLCIPDPATAGGPCGAGGHCVDGECVCDATSCPTGCCDGAQVCHTDEDAACGTRGEVCTDCTTSGVNQTCGGGPDGTPGVCGCIPTTCAAQNQTCGTLDDGCGTTLTCTGCAGCCDGTTCRTGQSNSACGTGGVDCISCSGTGVTCGGGSVAGQCGCTRDSDATTCTGKCGSVRNNCGEDVNCTAICAGCCDGNTCVAALSQSTTRCGSNGSLCQNCTTLGSIPANAVAVCTGGACTYTCDTGAGATECGSVCCAAGKRCTNAAAGTCCTPSCSNRVCGSDGCNGVCPPGCGTNQTCVEASGTCCTTLLETCSGSGQSSCCQTGGAAVCEAYAQCGTVGVGQRCCRLPGGVCRGNCDCCGDSTCLNGSCTGCTQDSQCAPNVCCSHACCATGQSCVNGECTSPAEVCKAKLEICTVDAGHPAPAGTCCQTNGELACQSYAACGNISAGTRCCVLDNGACGQLCDCCGSSRCFNGVCHPGPGQYPDSRCSSGTTLLGTCSNTSECCQYGEGSGSVVCAAYGAGCVVSAGQRCCRPAGKPCTDNCDCCGTMTCNSGTCG